VAGRKCVASLALLDSKPCFARVGMGGGDTGAARRLRCLLCRNVWWYCGSARTIKACERLDGLQIWSFLGRNDELGQKIMVDCS
jgi:formate dehydrogenase maturation protein FdhE